MLDKQITYDMISNSGVTIIQDKGLYSFNLDTILLTNFTEFEKSKKIVDLCAGDGAIGLTISGQTDAKIYLIELQKELSDLAQRSIEYNNKQGQVQNINDDLKKSLQYIEHDTVDTIICNPPYFKVEEETKIKKNSVLANARHEFNTNLSEIFKISKGLLKQNSKLYMVYRPDRIVEFVQLADEYNFKLNKLRFVHSHYQDNANLLLAEFIKTPKKGGVTVLPDLIIYKNKTEYTKEAKEIIYGK
ncbi:tRNA1(Val) (adenine(37)-N6)-methyltransferase [Companilactobacillus sp. DQM5]|uniref:tRNA1(Val) (adenine(37)-N6)-methyltransferase n=1 Tax=Companilactobacillus sp. DQM5 TaxID=3463359 RepID=UPI004058D1F4